MPPNRGVEHLFRQLSNLVCELLISSPVVSLHKTLFVSRENITMPEAQNNATAPKKTLNIFGRPLTIFGVPVERNTIFSDYKGNYKSRIEKRQRKLIVKAAFIKFFLNDDERIHCLTTGYSPISTIEQLLTGIAFLFLKRAIFVFTDKRILLIPTRFNRSSLGAVSQVLYEDCARIEIKGRTLVVQYKNGEQEQFPYIGRKERKKLKLLIADISLKPKEAGHLNDRVHLCPSCTNVLQPKTNICPSCNLSFRSVWQAKIRSILIPGGGYFYSRHPIIGALVGSLEIVLLSKIIYDWIIINQGKPVDLSLMAALSCAFIGEKLITTFHSQQLIQGFIPQQKDFAMRKN
jgi:hypothetical protein